MQATAAVGAPATINQPQEMSPNQKAFVQKAQQTVNRVVQELLTTMVECSGMEVSKFVATRIDPELKALSEIDARTNTFFTKMMDAINPEIDASAQLQTFFQVFSFITQDAQIRQKLVGVIALPHIKTMVTELDAINPSIVNDVNLS